MTITLELAQTIIAGALRKVSALWLKPIRVSSVGCEPVSTWQTDPGRPRQCGGATSRRAKSLGIIEASEACHM